MIIALVLTGAPVAVDLCQLTCADTAASQAHAGHDHAACLHPDAEPGLHLSPMPHPCDHGDGLTAPPPVSAVNVHTALPLLLAVDGTVLDLRRGPRTDLAPAESSPYRPLEIRLVRPLRI
jgi:hypothetical protein